MARLPVVERGCQDGLVVRGWKQGRQRIDDRNNGRSGLCIQREIRISGGV
ncbi:MAG TPA: hypothetical protein VFE84_05510 [Patescibacteria group bacterium]|nr:hypothetical protein [Patescibacteria group bacterium]